jgi:hypothetical protein
MLVFIDLGLDKTIKRVYNITMKVDLVTIPNFFKDPNSIFELAKRQQFYSRAENPDSDNIFYCGTRTMPLSSVLVPNVYDGLLREFFDRVFQVVEPPKQNVGFELNCVFHSLTETDRITPTDLHQDSSLVAGVVYLNDVIEIDPSYTGTILMKDSEKINVPYEYNKLVLYSGKYFHSANAGFGNDIASSRLTLNMFFNVKEIE